MNSDGVAFDVGLLSPVYIFENVMHYLSNIFHLIGPICMKE